MFFPGFVQSSINVFFATAEPSYFNSNLVAETVRINKRKNRFVRTNFPKRPPISQTFFSVGMKIFPITSTIPRLPPPPAIRNLLDIIFSSNKNSLFFQGDNALPQAQNGIRGVGTQFIVPTGCILLDPEQSSHGQIILCAVRPSAAVWQKSRG